MKMRRPHRVYLPRQAVELLQLLQAVTGMAEGYVFPSLCRRSVPMADVTLNHLFKRLDLASTTSFARPASNWRNAVARGRLQSRHGRTAAGPQGTQPNDGGLPPARTGG